MDVVDALVVMLVVLVIVAGAALAALAAALSLLIRLLVNAVQSINAWYDRRAERQQGDGLADRLLGRWRYRRYYLLHSTADQRSLSLVRTCADARRGISPATGHQARLLASAHRRR